MNKKAYIYLGGFLLLFLAYFVGYKNLQQNVGTAEKQVAELRTEESQLLDMKKNQKQNLADTKKMNAEIEDILKEFPADNYEEDSLLFADELEKTYEVHVKNLAFAGKNLVRQGEKSGYSLYTTPVRYDIIGGYNNIKQFVGAILEAKSLKNVENIHLAYDTDTGELQGDMTLNEFSIIGGVQEYVVPVIPGVVVGNQNPFGTVD